MLNVGVLQRLPSGCNSSELFPGLFEAGSNDCAPDMTPCPFSHCHWLSRELFLMAAQVTPIIFVVVIFNTQENRHAGLKDFHKARQ